MKLILLQIVLYLFAEHAEAGCQANSVTTFSYYGYSSAPVCSGDLIFEENFDTFNRKLWQHEITLSSFGHGEFQYYTDDRMVSYVRDGILNIRPSVTTFERGEDFVYNGTLDLGDKCTTRTMCKRTGEPKKILNPVASARIRTRGTFTYRYGKLEVRLKVPAGDWFRPAISLLPAKSIYGAWPMSGEVSVMESSGNLDLLYPLTARSTLHWGPDRTHDMWRKTQYSRRDRKGFHDVYHTFQFEWTPTHIRFRVNNRTIGEVHPPPGGFWELGNLESSGLENPWAGHSLMAPFDEDFFIVINLAVGGVNGYFPETRTKPWRNHRGNYAAMTQFWKGRDEWLGSWKLDSEQYHYKVDYIKIWAL